MPEQPHTINVVYRPIVDPLDNSVRFYRAIPVLRYEDGTTVIGHAEALRHEKDAMDTAERNAVVLVQATLALAAAHNHGDQIFLLVPINAAALSTKESATYLVRALKELDPIFGRAAVAQLFNLPEPTTMDRLDDALIPVMIATDKYIFEPPGSVKDYMDFGAINAQGVAMDLGVTRENDTQMSMTDLWSRAAPRKLKLFYQNVDNEKGFEDATRYEARGVDGSLFGGYLPVPGPRTNREKLKDLETVAL